MKIAIHGSKFFDDYPVFMRAMAVALSSMKDDKEMIVYALGPNRVNNFVTGFVNLSEDNMRLRGRKIKCVKRPQSWAEENISALDYVVYLANLNDRPSRLIRVADDNDVEAAIFRH